MKKSILVLSLGTLLLSCEKSEEERQDLTTYNFKTIAVSELPSTVQNHLQSTFPNHRIVSAEKDPTIGYEVALEMGWELYYNLNGSLLHKEKNLGIDDDRPVAISSLPQTILDYVARNHPQQTIVWAEWDDDEFEIYLSNGFELYFDANGNFISIDWEELIDPANLPQSVLSYVSQNYPNATILYAEFDDNYYEVKLDNGLELYFDYNGTYLGLSADDVPIDPTNLPASILSYIAQNYPNVQILSAELDDNLYEVELSNGVELYFDLNGNFLYADFD